MKDNNDLIQKIGNCLYVILIFLFVADPTNTIFGLKNIVFALFFFYNLVFLRVDWGKIIYILLPMIAVSLSWIFAMIQGNNVDLEKLKAVYTAFLPLLLLLWSYKYNVLKLSVIPVVLVASIVLLLFWTIVIYPPSEAPLYMFMWKHDNTIMMSNRYVLGIKFFCMYPKSAVSMLPVFGYSLYCTITKEKRTLSTIIMTLVLMHMFLISGTRSSVMLSIFLAATVVFIWGRNRRYMRYIAYPLMFVFFAVFAVVLSALLMETTEFSNMVKYAHLNSYAVLFEENPLYLLFGQGVATSFYTSGFNGFALETEWTYVEMIRNYGLFSLLIFYVLFRPIISMAKHISKFDVIIVFILSYIIYLIIAGTNPLLFSSTGMLVVLTMYSCAEFVNRMAADDTAVNG